MGFEAHLELCYFTSVSDMYKKVILIYLITGIYEGNRKLTDTISVLLLGVIIFMNLISVSTNTLPLSNPLQVDLNLTQVPALSETESEIAALT